MDMDLAFPSKYLRAADLEGKSRRHVIKDILMEKMQQGGTKPVIYFDGTDKGLVCNKTNKDKIKGIIGSANTDDWIGREIELYPTVIEFQGEEVDCIRIKSPALKAKKSPVLPASKVAVGSTDPVFDDEIPI